MPVTETDLQQDTPPDWFLQQMAAAAPQKPSLPSGGSLVGSEVMSGGMRGVGPQKLDVARTPEDRSDWRPAPPLQSYEEFTAALEKGGANSEQTFSTLMDSAWASKPPEWKENIYDDFVRKSAYDNALNYGEKTRRKIVDAAQVHADKAFPGLQVNKSEYERIVRLYSIARKVVKEWNATSTMGGDDLLLEVTPKDRDAFRQILSEVAQKDLVKDEGFWGKLGQQISSGVMDMDEALTWNMNKALTHIPGRIGKEFEKSLGSQEWLRESKGIILQSGNPASAKEYGALKTGVLEAGRMAPSMLASTAIPASKIGAGAKAVAQTAFWAGMTRPDVEADLVRRGASRELAGAVSLGVSLASGALENLAPDQLLFFSKPAGKAALRQYLKQALVQYSTEYSEEFYQSLTESTGRLIASMIDPNVQFDPMEEAYGISQTMKKTAIPLAVMMAPGAVKGGVDAKLDRGRRLKGLKAGRAGSDVLMTPEGAETFTQENPRAAKWLAEQTEAPSRKNWEAIGLPPIGKDSRAEFQQNVRDILAGEEPWNMPEMVPGEESQVEILIPFTEAQDAGEVRSPEEEVREDEGGEDIRGTGEVEVPAEPAGEGTPAREAEVPRAEVPVAEGLAADGLPALKDQREPHQISLKEWEETPRVVYSFQTDYSTIDEAQEFIDRKTRAGTYKTTDSWRIATMPDGSKRLVATQQRTAEDHKKWLAAAVANGEITEEQAAALHPGYGEAKEVEAEVPAPKVETPPAETPAPSAAPLATPEWKEARIKELAEKKRKSGNEKYTRNPDLGILDAITEVEEEAERLQKYPPGTELKIEGYPMPFRVQPDGALIEINTGRTMGDNAGAVLRRYKPSQIKVVTGEAPSAPKVEATPPPAPTPKVEAPKPAPAPKVGQKGVPKKPQTPTERFFSEMPDEEVTELAEAFGAKGSNRAEIIADLESRPGVKEIIEANQPAEEVEPPPKVVPKVGRKEAQKKAPEARSVAQLQQDLEESIPGSVVEQSPDNTGVKITLPNGTVIEGLSTPPIQPKIDTAAKDYGVTESQMEQRVASSGVAGATVYAGMTVTFTDGTQKTFDEVTMLFDLDVADRTTAFHEPHHVAMALGFYDTPLGERIYKSLLAKYHSDEGIATAREEWIGPNGLLAKIRAFLQQIIDQYHRWRGYIMNPELAMAKTFTKKFWSQADYRNPRFFPGTTEAGPLTPAGGIAYQIADVEKTKLEIQGRGLPGTVGADLGDSFDGLKQWLYTELASLSDLVNPKSAWQKPKEGQSLIEYGRKFFTKSGIEELKRTFKGSTPPVWVEDKKLWQDIKGDLLIAEKIAKGKPSKILSTWAKRFLSTNIKTGGFSWDFALMTCLPTERCSVCYAKSMATVEESVSKARLRHTIVTAMYPQVVGNAIGQWAAAQPKGDFPFLRVNGAGDSTFMWQVDAINAAIEVMDRPVHIFSRSHRARTQDGGSLGAISNGHYDPKDPANGCVVYKMGSVDKQLRDEYGDQFLKDNLEKRGIFNSYLVGSVEDVPIVQEMHAKGIFLILHVNATNAIVTALDQAGMLATSDRSGSMIIVPMCACALETGPKINGCATCLVSGGPCFAWGTQVAMTPKGKLYTYKELLNGKRAAPKDGLVPMAQIGMPSGEEGKQVTLDVIAKSYESAVRHLRGVITSAMRNLTNINVYNPRSRETIVTLKPTKANAKVAQKIAANWTGFAESLRAGTATQEQIQQDAATIEGTAAMDRAAEKFAGRTPEGPSYQIKPGQTGEQYVREFMVDKTRDRAEMTNEGVIAAWKEIAKLPLAQVRQLAKDMGQSTADKQSKKTLIDTLSYDMKKIIDVRRRFGDSPSYQMKPGPRSKAYELLREHLQKLKEAEEAAKVTPEQLEEQYAPKPIPDEDVTGIKKAAVNALRALVGLPEMEGVTPETVQQWVDEVAAKMKDNPLAAIQLVNELSTNRRALTERDWTMLQFRYRQLKNDLKPFQDAYNEAVASGDPVATSTALTGLMNARHEMSEFEEVIHPWKSGWGRSGVALQQMFKEDFTLAAMLRRGQEANAGEELDAKQTAEMAKLAKQYADALKELEAEQSKSAALERELASQKQHEEVVKAAKSGRKKSDVQKERMKKEAALWDAFRAPAASYQLGKLSRGVSYQVTGGNAAAVDALVEFYRTEIGVTSFSELMGHVRAKLGDKSQSSRRLFQQAWQSSVDTTPVELPELDMDEPAGLSREARRIQRALVESGMTDREEVIAAVREVMQEYIPDFTKRQTMDALSRYGQFSLPSEEDIAKTIGQMNAEILRLSQLNQLEKAIKRAEELKAEGVSEEEIGDILDQEDLLVKATGVQRRKPHPKLRDLTKDYNDLKKELPPTTEKREGRLQSAQDAIKTALANRIDDLNRAIEKREPITRNVRTMPETDTIRNMRAERDRLQTIYKSMFPQAKRTLTEEQRTDAAIRAASRAIEELEQQLATGNVAPKQQARLTSPELNLLRARLEQLRSARDALRAETMPELKEERARKSHEASLRKRIADYEKILASGDFAPKAKKPARTPSQSELEKMRKLDDVRHKVLQKYAEYHLAHMKGIAWTADKAAEMAHLSRALMTSFDMSAVARQGGLVAMGHPLMAERALRASIASILHTFDPQKAMALRDGVTKENLQGILKIFDSRQAEFDFMHKLTSGPDGELRALAGLNLPSSDEVITRQEEAFQGRWAKFVPGVSVSSRQYTMVLNQLRADLFDLMVHNLGRNGQVTLDEAKLIANFVNVMTGRSSAIKWRGRDVTAILNLGFFSPRYVASRFQFLAMPFYLPFKGGVKANWRVKRAIYKEMGRTYAGIGITLGAIWILSNLFWDDDDEDKPRIEFNRLSTDFLKVRIGDTRLDFLAGLQQVMVLSARMAPEWMGGGATKSTVTGKITKFGEGQFPQNRLTISTRFLRTKLAPVPGAITTGFNDWTNVVGQKETVGSLALGLVTPLSMRDIPRTIQMQGATKGSAMGLLSFIGVGMNTFGPKTEYVTGTPDERQEQYEKDLENMKWDSPAPAYSEFLTPDQMEKVVYRQKQVKGNVIKSAFAVPGAGSKIDGMKWEPSEEDLRNDGTIKGEGWLGRLEGRGPLAGETMTEYTIGIEVDGKEIEIPTLIPWLTDKELDSVLRGDITPAVEKKAIQHAKERLANKQSVFKDNPKPDSYETYKAYQKAVEQQKKALDTLKEMAKNLTYEEAVEALQKSFKDEYANARGTMKPSYERALDGLDELYGK